MQCPKCKGRMFAEKYYDFVRSFDAWKCTCCGELLDSTILANRARNIGFLRLDQSFDKFKGETPLFLNSRPLLMKHDTRSMSHPLRVR
jgi:hypothetical protein